MRFGFVGAGKVGVSLGKYFVNGGIDVAGYASKHIESAKQAAEFTGTGAFESVKELMGDCDALILTVPDREISAVYEEIKKELKKPMCLIHCSGLESSAVFYDLADYQSYGYSIHPLLAVSSKYESYRELSKAFFTIEGDIYYLDELRQMLMQLGNPVIVLNREQKVKYHAASVFASNLVLALLEESLTLLKDCGFSEEEAKQALTPLALGNLVQGLTLSPREALTGPVERGDITTVKRHRGELITEQKALYDAGSKVLLEIAKKKHPKRDYSDMEKVLKEGK